LVIGRRTNVKLNSSDNLYHPSSVTRVARERGELFFVKGEDYFFIARNAYPWQYIPDLVIARNGYDNFVVAVAIENKVSVIDATATLLALHQTDDEGNFAGASHRKDKRINRKIIRDKRRFHFSSGFTSSAPYETINVNKNLDKKMTIIVKKRKRLSKITAE